MRVCAFPLSPGQRAGGTIEVSIMDENNVVPSPAGLGDPSPGDERDLKESVAAANCSVCTSNADLLNEIVSLLHNERTEAARRESRLRSDMQFVRQRLRAVEDELEDFRSSHGFFPTSKIEFKSGGSRCAHGNIRTDQNS